MRTAVLVVLVACGGLIAFAQEATGTAAVSRIIALENAWNRAAETQDLKALERILDDAFVAVQSDGALMIKAEVLKDVKDSGVVHITAQSMVVHLHGETAIATGLYQMKGAARGKPFLRRGRFVDTWLCRDGRWVALASVSVPIE